MTADQSLPRLRTVLGEPISFYDIKRGDLILIATLAETDAPEPEDDIVGVLRVLDDSTTRLWRKGHIDLPEASS